MPDKHPIDDLFRQALTGAAVEPPAELGRAILAQAHARHRRVLLWRRRLLALLLLLLGTGAGIAWVANRQANEPERLGARPGANAAAEERKTERSASEDAASGVAPDAEQLESDQRGAKGESRGARPNENDRGSTGSRNAPARASSSATIVSLAPATSATDAPASASGGTTAEQALNDAPGSSSSPVPDARAEWISPNVARITVDEPSASLVAARTNDYYTPRGHWWMAIGVTAQSGRYRWDGESEKLARALEGSGRWNPGFAAGLSAGRRWPSGLSLGVGVEAERSRQTFRNVERATVTRTETVEQVVVLNTHVFSSDLVTVNVQEQREAVAEGADTRLRVRIPLEAAWSLRLGRWSAGPRAGLITEYTRARSSSSLGVDPSDGMIRARTLTNEELGHRYPVAFSGLVGIDLGIALRDRLTLLATPFYARTLATAAPSSDATASPDRAGLRLLIQHRF